MPAVKRTVLVEFSAERMYELVSDIEAYPDFLPWCAAARIRSQDAGKTIASLRIDFRGFQQEFTTENASSNATHINIKLVSGPFRALQGGWIFQSLSADACKITLSLDYDFSSRLIAGVLGPVFHHIADTMVEAFVTRARDLWGK